MNCEQFREAIVGDEPEERAAAEAHAEGCPTCADLLSEHDALADEVAVWAASTASPPAELEHRIGAAIEGRTPSFGWLAAAATILLGLWLGWQILPVGGPGLSPMEQAMLEADRSRENYIRAVAELERQAAPILARAADQNLAPERAALLLRYGDRLQRLDSVIAEVQGFLEENPGHAGGDTVLLAAFQEKQQVLGELLELQLGESS